MAILLPTTYHGNIQFFTKFLIEEKIIIEQFDSYQKQTFRNRCTILAANGPLNLTIPIIKQRNQKTLVKDVRIDYDTNWQNNHWRSIISAYNKSPFLEYYIDEFEPFYQKKWNFLIDFNIELLRVTLDQLELETSFQLSEDFIEVENNYQDYRSIISPKNKTLIDSEFQSRKYTQAFSEKFGFTSNLSILDLLFNCGPESALILEQSISNVE